MRKLLLAFFLICAHFSIAQTMRIAGNVQDTIAKKPLANAVAMAVRIKDSVLLGFTRTDANGYFELKKLPIDTVQIIVSHPQFSEQSFYVFASAQNFEFDFGKIVLPSKTQQLNEVIIYAFKDPVYYKGDTLIYTADSFKVKPNATVEDLLKKLPGIKVDAQGKITSQGKAISQVLVDGDEFFGTDPTVATKNLAASGVESVQVYEKKDENAKDGSSETVQVMNLKLKDEAKKGYFGKVSGASDFQRFHEGELLANKFNKQQKISVFSLVSNTPRSSLGWQDMYKYGLDNEMNYESNDDGTMMWYSGNNQNNGVPRTIKSGVYYVDKISKKTKLNFNYTYANNRLIAKSETRTQYFLNDTSYVTNNELESKQTTESHTINFGVVQTIDSLTELQIKPKLVLNSNNTTSTSINKFITSTDTLTRTNTIENNNKASGYEAAVIAIFNRKFKKKDRLFVATLNANFKNNNADAILQSVNVFYTNLFFPNNDINQNKINKSESNSYNAKLVYTEPLTKKIKVEVEYVFNQTKNHQSKKTYNYFNGDYSLSDSLFTNDFNNTTMFNRAGAKFIYESKKTRFAVGSRYQLNNLSNQNLITNKSINYNTSAILPFVSYNYRFSENTRFNIGYYSFVNQPSVNQLQPVPDNTNPNRVILGNASLKPSYNNTIEMWFNTWKPISGRNVWANASYNIVNNAFANSTTFDSIGRTISQTVNVNDNSNGNFYIGGGLPFFQKLLELYGNANGSYSSYSNFVNNQKNKTTAKSLSLGLSLQIQADTIEFSIGADYTWNYTQSTLNAASNKPYGNQSYNAAVRFKLPYKFTLESEANYNILTKREQGYNINYLVWNAALRKSFFKNETLIISIEAYDLLNQNISTNRTIQDNTITDNRTTIINQYFLLRAVFKFNSNKTKDNEEEW